MCANPLLSGPELCACCWFIPATVGPWCEGCLEHLRRDYYTDDTFCPVYDAWCHYTPYPWEVAA